MLSSTKSRTAGKILVQTLFFFLLVTQICFAQELWERMNGPYGGVVEQMVVNTSGYVFATTGFGGLYRSTDNGDTWSEILKGNPVNGTNFTSVTTNSLGHMFVSTIGYILRSTDNGETWLQVALSDPNKCFFVMAINADGHIFAGAVDGMYRSLDNGETWQKINNGLGQTYLVRCITIDKRGHLYIGFQEGGIYRSTNDGENWTLITQNFTGIGSLLFTISDFILIVTYQGLFRSYNYGQTWSQLYINDYPSRMGVDSLGYVFLSTNSSGVLRSADEGTTWQPVNKGLFNDDILCFTVNQNNDAFAGSNGGGVYRSTNNGNSWLEVNTGFDNASIFCLAMNDNSELFAGTYGSGIQRISPNDTIWTRSSDGMTDPRVWALEKSNGDLMLSSTPEANYRSTDGGHNWIHMQYPSYQFYSYTTNSNGDIYAGSQRIYKSTNNGNSWQSVLDRPNYSCFTSIITNDSSHIFAANNEGGIYRSIDNGENWSLFEVDAIYILVNSICVGNNGYIYVGAHTDGWTYSNIYRSTDNGEHWIEASFGVKNRQALDFAINSLGYLFVATNDDGVYRSTDNGESWIPYGLSQQCILSIFIDPEGYLYAGSGGGGISTSGNHLYRSHNSTVTDIQYSKNVEVLFQLEQNYPNPFNPSTTIKYSVPQTSQVQMKVFDVLGNEVEALINEEKPVGTYEIEFNAANLPSGVYFYQLKAGTYVETKKMILIK